MTPETLDALVALRAARTPAVLATWLADGHSKIFIPGSGSIPIGLTEPLDAALLEDRPRLVETSEGEIFLNPFNPPLRMAILGAVHIAQPLAMMAGLLGYAVTIIDPRTAFATKERFPDVALDHDWPDEALQNFKPDRRSAVVALTHDPKLDDPALDIAIRSPAFYIAALGSKKTQAARLQRMRAHGHEETALSRIRGPAGLPIGAKSPAEIAISILAEMTAALRGSAP